MVIELLFFIFGIIIGSFLNVCIYRLPREKSILNPPSHCMSCNTKLKPVDLIPVVSYFLLQGRCRYCGAKIPFRYALVELLTSVLFVWCYTVFGFNLMLVKALILTAFVVIITFIDFDHQLILDKVLIWFAGTGIAVNLLETASTSCLSFPGWLQGGYVTWLDMFIGAIAGGGLMLLLAIISRGGMGGGDIKFAAALGLWLGWKLTFFVLFFSFLVGGLSGAILMLFRLKKRKDFIPFGPFIAFAAFIGLLYGQSIIAWYLDNLH